MNRPGDPALRMDRPLLACLVAELKGVLPGRSLLRVSVPIGFTEDLLLFFSRQKAPELPEPGDPGPVLRVVVTPPRTRLHLQERPAEACERPHLVSALSKAIAERTLASLDLEPGERLVLLRFMPGLDPSEPASLLLELFPPGAWILLDGEQRVLLASREGAGGRGFSLGMPWSPPRPRPPRADSIGPGCPVFDPPRDESPSRAVARAFEELDALLLAQAHRRRCEAILSKAEAKAVGRVAALERQAAEGQQASTLRKHAELLKANLKRVRPGQAFLEVEDFFEAGLPLVHIPLDPAVSAKETMQALFHRARRLERGQAQVAARLAEAQRLAALARQARADLDAGRPWEAILEAAKPLLKERLLVVSPGSAPRPVTDRTAERAAPGERFRRFTSREGMTILVGRSARQNDLLTLRVARGNDLWFHASGGRGGSHVVVRVPRGKAPSPETLLDAAHLALHYSQARGRPRAEVLWAQRKWVRKPKGLPPGQVRVDRFRTLLIDFDPQLLARLLASAAEEKP